MGGIIERMETVTDAAGALLELQEVIESCLKQTNPADVWDIGQQPRPKGQSL